MSDHDMSTPVDDIGEGFYDILETQRSIADGHVELESLLNATDALESLSLHLDTYDVVSIEHRQALIVSFENLVVGSGVTVSDIIPELDGHSLGRVSTESLKDKLYGLWKRIVAAIMSVLAAVKRFWLKVASFRGRLRMNAEHMAKLGGVRKLTTSKNREVTMGIEIKSFIQGDRPLNDPDAIIRAMAAGLEQYKTLTGVYGTEMVRIGKEFEHLLNSSSSGDQALRVACDIFEGMPIAKMASKVRALIYRDPRFGNRLTMAAPPIIGGWTIFFLTLEKEQEALKETNLVAYAMALRTMGVKVAYSDPNGFNISGGTLRTASGAQVQSMALMVLNILDAVEAQEKAASISKIESQIKTVLRGGENYQSRVLEPSGHDQSVLRFVRNYATWAVGPVDQLTTNLLSVSRSALMYCRRSLDH